jgi:hypothetical protein
LDREEREHEFAGEESRDGRCGIPIEAKPLSGKTCLIEAAERLASSNRQEGTGRWLCQAVHFNTERSVLGKRQSDAALHKLAVVMSL